MKKTRRSWTPQQKMDIVMEVAREEKTLSQIARELSISPTVISRWKSELLAGANKVFSKGGGDYDRIIKEYEEEKEALERKIGELTMENDWLKKKHQQVYAMRRKKL